MLSVNSPCFLLVPNEQNTRLLVPGKVLELKGSNAIVKFDEPITLKTGDEATIFAQWRDKFFQQSVKVEAAPVNDLPAIEFARVGEPISAESRGSYRVSVATSQLYAQVGEQYRCHVVDISPEGCAVISAQPLTIGQTVNVRFSFENVIVEGAMKVQTLKKLSSGKLRFGLFVTEKKSPARQALEKLSILMQRLQLKRLAGAA